MRVGLIWDDAIGATEVEWATTVCRDPAVAVAWRTRFRAPTPDVVFECLNAANLTLVCREDGSKRPVCIFQIHDLDCRFWHAQVSALGDPLRHGTPTMGRALIFGMAVAFARYPVRKVYAEALDWAPVGARGLRYLRRFDLEGTLRDHVFVGGRWCDVRLYALWRSAFLDIAPARVQADARGWVDAHPY